MQNPQDLSADYQALPKALELKAAAILLVIALILVGAAGYILYARGVFEKSQVVTLIAEDAEGVSVGMDMTFAGFAIGRVTRVTLHDDGRARLEVEVPQKQGKWLRETSVFTLERGLIGSPKLKAYTGLLEGPLLPDGAERVVLYGDVSAQIPQITLAARELLEHLAEMTGPQSDMSQTLASLRELSARLNGKHGALGVILGTQSDPAVVKQTLVNARDLVKSVDALATAGRQLVERADEQVFGAQGAMPEVQQSIQEVNALLKDVRSSMKRVDRVLEHAQGIGANTEAATQDLVALRAEVERSMRQVNTMIQSIQSKWPFSSDAEIRLP